MSFYKVSGLPIPTGFVDATPLKINSNGVIAGTCDRYSGPTNAIVWDGGGYSVIGPPGLYSYAQDINSNQVMAGNYVDNNINTIPFLWDKATGILTELPIPAQNGNGLGCRVFSINDKNKMSGCIYQANGAPYESCLFWASSTTNPAAIPNPNADSWGAGINNHGIIIGAILNSTDFQGFYMDSSTKKVHLIPGSRGCTAINDLKHPQILFYWNEGTYLSYVYDTLTKIIFDLNVPGDTSFGLGMNNNFEVVGETQNDGAVLWQGLIKLKLNHPLISDAQIKGWHLTRATSINDKGDIVGRGIFGGKELPCLLTATPGVILHKIQVEYMLPHFVWPGDPYEKAKPKDWPKGWPFPLSDPLPFELVGEAYKIKQDIAGMQQVQEIMNNMNDSATANALKENNRQINRTTASETNDNIGKKFPWREKAKKQVNIFMMKIS